MIFPDLDLMDLEDIPPVRRYYDVMMSRGSR